MASDTALTIFVGITAIAFLGQAIGVILIYRRISETTQRVHELSGEVQKKISSVAEDVADVTRTFKPLGEHLQTITANLVSISHTARVRTEDVDAFLGETTRTLRAQLGQINEVFTQTTLRFEDTANRVQRGIIAPVNEISAMVKGLRAGFGLLFSRWPGNTGRRPPLPDDDLFI